MSGPRPQIDPEPPPLAAWLATRRVPVVEREFLIGDLNEEFHERARGAAGRKGATRWYWRQAVRCLLLRYRALDRSPAPVSPQRKGKFMETLLQDVRFALRMLRRTPGFTATAVITLALGIGASTAIFSVVDAVLFAPLPFAEADRIVLPRNGPRLEESTPVSYPAFQEWRDAGVFEHTGAYFGTGAAISGNGDAEQVIGFRMSASVFDVLGVRPVIGSLFQRADEARTAPPKVLIGEGLWKRRFGGAADVIGQSLSLSGQPFTIVGVLPATFRIRPGDVPPDIVLPLRLTEQLAPVSLNFLSIISRLKPGQSADRARDELQALVRRLHPDADEPATVNVTGLRQFVVRDSTRVLWALLGAVGLLLLIACANLANLLLARATARRREMSVRLALGAGRIRIVRQLLTESLALALLGGLAGLGVAWLGVTAAGHADAVRAAGAYDVRINLVVLGFTLAISCVAGILFGVAPASDASRQSVGATMGTGTRVAVGSSTLRATLVATEIALTLVLLLGSGLLIRSFGNLIGVDTGFDTGHVVSFGLAAPAAKYPTPEARTQFLSAAIANLSGLPAVTGVGLVSELPLAGGGTNGTIRIEGRTFPAGQEPQAEKRIVSPDYFRALGIAVVKGRSFTDRDRAGSSPVMVISEGFARKFFPDRDPIGQRAGFNWDIEGVQEIVGVVADVKHYDLNGEPEPTVYVSYLQRPLSSATFVLKTMGESGPVMSAARAAIRRLDPDRPLTAAATMEELISRSVATRRFALWLVTGFSTIALVLAATGIYGVVAYNARQRIREFGIRLALGAASRQVLQLVIRQSVLPVAAGLVMGAGGALALASVIRAQLFGVEPNDPTTFVVVSAILAAIALGASYLPARRATRINPAVVLRSD